MRIAHVLLPIALVFVALKGRGSAIPETKPEASDTRGADSVIYSALRAGDLNSPTYWAQDVSLVGDQALNFLTFSPQMAVDRGHPKVVARKRVDPVNGHAAYVLTVRFQNGEGGLRAAHDTARISFLAVNYGTNGGWKVGNVLALRTEDWRVEHAGPLAVHLPRESELPMAWLDAGGFADSLARAYGVSFPPEGIPSYAAPSVPFIAGVDAETHRGGWIAYYDPESGRLIAPLDVPPIASGVLRHEISHAVLLRSIGNQQISWAMAEGAAVYYGGGYGCVTSEAFFRRLYESKGTPALDKIDLAVAHALDRQPEAIRKHTGLLGAILATAMADAAGGPQEVKALLRADALDLASSDSLVGSDRHLRRILGIGPGRGELDSRLVAFGFKRGRAVVLSPDSGVRSRAWARCATDSGNRTSSGVE